MLLDIDQNSSGHLYTLGERGRIYVSFNQGKTWQKKVAATSQQLLTAIHFSQDSSSQVGWAVGHNSTVLNTFDSGKTWNIATIVQQNGNQDPFFDVIALDKDRIIVIGSYGQIYHSANSGRSWQKKKLPLEEDFHLNAVKQLSNGELLIAAEKGIAYLSKDLGREWQKIQAPTKNSFFNFTEVNGQIYFHGLLGDIWKTSLSFSKWEKVPFPLKVPLYTSVVTPDGHIVFAGAQGLIAVMNLSKESFKFVRRPHFKTIAQLHWLDRQLFLVGDMGLEVLSWAEFLESLP